MSKTLFLVRHAEAEEPANHLKDIDRVLTPTGRRDATRLGNYFAEEDIMPDIIMSSTAVRAINTAEIIAERVKYNIDRIEQNEDLYEASVRILLKAINELPNDTKKVLMVAHNPGITFLADYLTVEDIGGMAAGTLITLKLDLEDWSQVSQHTANIKIIRSPD